MHVQLTVFAHNEQQRIAACLESLPLDDADCTVTVVVNGSTDATADNVRRFADRGVECVEFEQGGKSRSWNRFVLDENPRADLFVFADGDARFAPGTVDAFRRCAEARPDANALAGLPCNGRRHDHYRALLREEGGIFGDCYALSGRFVERLRASGVRLPDDLVGDDSLLGALAATGIGRDADWDRSRVLVCDEAGFLCDPTPLTPSGIGGQARRMVNYSVRHFQNRIVSSIMRGEGAHGLPVRVADLYPEWLERFSPRLNPVWYPFDRAALKRMAAAA